MNLKNFHFVFIVISTLLCIGFGLWAVRGSHPSAQGLRAFGYGAWLCAAGLVVYGAVYFRKLQRLQDTYAK